MTCRGSEYHLLENTLKSTEGFKEVYVRIWNVTENRYGNNGIAALWNIMQPLQIMFIKSFTHLP